MKPLAALALALTVALAACGKHDEAMYGVPLPPPKIKRTMLKDTVPKSLRQCADAPDGSAVEDHVVDGADFIEELADAGADCRRKVKALDRLIQNEAE